MVCGCTFFFSCKIFSRTEKLMSGKKQESLTGTFEPEVSGCETSLNMFFCLWA